MTAGRVYIEAASQISIQEPLSENWMKAPVVCQEPFAKAVDPPWGQYFAPNQMRRSSAYLKRALAVSLEVLKRCNVEHPDAIISGTCFGSLERTNGFLKELCGNKEEALSPMFFMQAIHNAVSTTIAIATETKGYNTTYSHANMSFDAALSDGFMQMQLGNISNALVGGHEETSAIHFELLKKVGYVGVEGMVPYSDISVAMMLNTKESDENLCELAGVRLLNNPSLERVKEVADKMLQDAQVKNIDAVMTGANGNPSNDTPYFEMAKRLFKNKPLLTYKNLFGENFAASAAGVYAAAHIVKRETIGSIIVINRTEKNEVSLTILKRL
ncbi:MAG: beta-ketoacyl synthase chain length factor [Bacteroidales bacterium]|nr:beta-ketoacyl synthase chain length factor [Bacteroidales bacterium]